MKRSRLKIILPVFLALVVVVVLLATGHIPPTSPYNGSHLKIIIYTDFQCGACEKLHSEVEPQLRERYVDTGKAEIEIRLLGPDSNSMRGAQAALCAGDQGKFLEYIDALFAAYYGQGEDIGIFSAEALISLAGELGLDEAAFATCLNSEAKKAEIQDNMDNAQADGISTIPALLVGNITIQGHKPLDTYIRAVEEALAAQTVQ